MKKSFHGCCLTTVMMAMISILFNSCVDQQYDLANIDSEAVFLRDATMPVGNLKPISIGDIINIDESQSLMISSDANGDFQFVIHGDESISASVTVPTFNIELEEGLGEERKLSLDIPSVIAGMDVSILETLMPEYYSKNLSFEDMTGKKASLRKSVKVNEDCYLPHYISDIKEVEFGADVVYEFTLSVKDNNGVNINSYGGAMYIEEGFTIDFPDWFVIRKNDDIDGYSIVNQGDNKNVILFGKDVVIPADKSVTFDIFVSKLEVPVGSITDGGFDSEGRPRKKLDLDVNDEQNMILIDGDVYVRPSDFKKVPSSVEMNMHLSFKSLTVKSVLASLNVDETLPEQTFTLPEVPEVFKRDGVVIDLYDPSVTLSVNNPSPLDINVYAHMFAFRGNSETMNMYFGENGQNVPFTVPREFNGNIGFSRRGEGGMIANPSIAQLFRTLPDKLNIRDIRITASNNYISICPGQTLECSVAYTFKAPLAFGPELAVSFEYDLKELKLDLEDVGLKSALLSFDVLNTIPLSLDLQAVVVDEEGRQVNDVTISVDGDINAGSLTAPSASPISIKLVSKTKGFHLDGLKLLMNASCPADYQGITVNKNQGLEIRDLKVSLPDGISMDLDIDEIFYSEE